MLFVIFSSELLCLMMGYILFDRTASFSYQYSLINWLFNNSFARYIVRNKLLLRFYCFLIRKNKKKKRGGGGGLARRCIEKGTLCGSCFSQPCPCVLFISLFLSLPVSISVCQFAYEFITY